MPCPARRRRRGGVFKSGGLWTEVLAVNRKGRRRGMKEKALRYIQCNDHCPHCGSERIEPDEMEVSEWDN